ncbi:hypothetical protein SUGI_0931750 [Cryptomeria japonica]|nr:hypothetical protein SUGI_0931750 [Cryptomeria japonica]
MFMRFCHHNQISKARVLTPMASLPRSGNGGWRETALELFLSMKTHDNVRCIVSVKVVTDLRSGLLLTNWRYPL